jgi:hypothetical protein
LDQRLKAGVGRYTLREAHDAAYRVLPSSLKQIIEDGVFGRVVLYTIEREVIFDSAFYNGNVASAVAGLVDYVRENLHSPIENLLADINDIHSLAVQLDCNKMVLDDIEALNSEIIDFAH